MRRAYDRFVRIRGDPRQIAMGLTLGVFLGASPLFGFQLLLAVLIAALLRWNKIAAAMGTLISNPIREKLRERSSRLKERIRAKVASRE